MYILCFDDNSGHAVNNIGPFSNISEAYTWAEKFLDKDWHYTVLYLISPDSYVDEVK